MTSKIYKTAQGRTVDLGALILQNENIRAVGNMNVNARGDILDSADQVIDRKNSQIRRQNERQIRTSDQGREVHISTRQARETINDTDPVTQPVLDTADNPPTATTQDGLAGALARLRGSHTENK